MKVIVTGGAGLIGSFLTEKFVDCGHDVLVLDNFTYSYNAVPPPTAGRDLAYRNRHLLKGATVVRCSTLEKARLRRLFDAFEPEIVVHLAAISLVEVATQNVEAAADSLSAGLINVLETVRELASVRRFVYASSSMVYGNFRLDPMPEDGPVEPLNIYGGLKLAGEVMTRAYLRPTPTEYAIVRPSAVYGPTDQHRRVVQKFCENAMTGRPLKLNVRNDHVMDFTYVADAVHGFHLAATHPAAADETFNISFGSARSLSDLAIILRERFPDLRLSAEDIDDHDRPTRGTLEIGKARRLLGFQPQWPLEAGIARYLDYLTDHASLLVGAA